MKIYLKVFVSLCLAMSSLGAPNLLEGGHHNHEHHNHGQPHEHSHDQPHEHSHDQPHEHSHDQPHEHSHDQPQEQPHHAHDASQPPSVYFIPAPLTPSEPHAHADHAQGAPEAKAEPEGKAEYSFEYVVKEEATDFSAQEHRDGDKTEGSYQILLPDTRVQKVTYIVDGDSGFVADVIYEGEAKEHGDQLHTSAAVDIRSVYAAPHHSA
ncbi:uncharacterized histidine-rich protein DDB_G0274557-like [Penaeus chinensis]|uniref:uncharacterized histidine-rich protein DDB_G0274557-like n=1 Tax=Penaeus chinensis TaxID=139456 RepID=UPI001FB8328E|nr:uncharacterized histidine-rich protein DDB_G0274557-like [Penaeus chinensis]